MCQHVASPQLPLPRLSDEAAVEILDFLHEVLTVFESRYADQIHRYYEDRSRHNLIEPDQHRPAEDPPFRSSMPHTTSRPLQTLTVAAFRSSRMMAIDEREHHNIKLGDHTHTAD